MNFKTLKIYCVAILASYFVSAGFFSRFNLRKWIFRIKEETFTQRSMMKSVESASQRDDSWSNSGSQSSMLDSIPMESMMQEEESDSWGGNSGQMQTCSCNCGRDGDDGEDEGGGKGGKKGKKGKKKGKKGGGGGGTMAIVIPRYEYFDVPMAKPIETENLGSVMEKAVTYQSKGWGWGGGGGGGSSDGESEDQTDDSGW